MRKFLLLLALLLFGFYQYGLWRWLLSGHGWPQVWQAAQADWLVAMTLLDGGVFAALSLIWLARDVRRRGGTGWQATAWVAACLLWGAGPLLLYLARRAPASVPG